jgi:transcriptional regulator with XRE-family HTH domain
MDYLRVGRSYRALRIRKSWRQQDLADEAGVSRQLIAKVEAGKIDVVQVGNLLRIGEALGASVDINLRWRGEALDRLLDAAHADLVEAVVARLTRLGWESVVEATFSVAGERGSIDVFALNRATATVLVIEVKSVVPDSQAMISALDRKTRLAAGLAHDRGWPCRTVGRLLVVGASTAARRRVEALSSTYQTAFPVRGTAVSAWLRSPAGTLSGLLFVPFATQGGTRNRVTGRQRVRKRVA